MNIYIVTKGTHDDYRIVGTFSTRAKAKAFLNEASLDALVAEGADLNLVGLSDEGYWHCGSKWESYGIEEVALDTMAPLEWRAHRGTVVDCAPIPKGPAWFVGTAKAIREYIRKREGRAA